MGVLQLLMCVLSSERSARLAHKDRPICLPEDKSIKVVDPLEP